jgi:hypothetical protein
VDVKRHGDLGILGGLLRLSDVDLEIAGGSQLISGPGIPRGCGTSTPPVKLSLELSSNLKLKQRPSLVRGQGALGKIQALSTERVRGTEAAILSSAITPPSDHPH